MAYSDFTLREVQRRLQVSIDEEADLYTAISSHPISAWLQETLQETLPLVLAINTEKVRSELVIAPILVEVRRQMDRTISFFSGIDFSVDASQGLTGNCDYIVSLSAQQLFINAPVLMIVEAKNENIKGGLAQCIATMVAAQRFNEKEGLLLPYIYGVVTTGTNWRFLQLSQHTVEIDQREYYIDQVEKILGILLAMVGANDEGQSSNRV